MELKLKDEEFNRLVSFMRNNYGINLIKKRVLIEGRLSHILQQKGFTDYTTYLNNVFNDKSGKEMSTLINKLTTNHTYFLREPEHFEYMKQVVLPHIEATVKDRDARIWCAASSTGEEPYTMAMVIDEYFGTRKKNWDLRILATDISTDVLAKARIGIYSGESVSTLPAIWRTKYFTKHGDDSYRISDDIRKEVVFKQFNLMDDIITKKPFDLISCRNVMIYFEGDTKNSLVKRFYDVTKDKGYLFIGHAESIPRNYYYTYIKPAIYQKQIKLNNLK